MHMQAHICTHKHVHTCTFTHKCTFSILRCMHARTHTHTRACARATEKYMVTHKYLHIKHTQKHTHIHTCTHSSSCRCCPTCRSRDKVINCQLKSVKCYPGGRKIHFIPSMCKIQSQMWYHCVQYTRRHIMSLISHC